MPRSPKPIDPERLTDAQVTLLELALRGRLKLPSAEHDGTESRMTRRLAEAGLLWTDDSRHYLATDAGRKAYERSPG